MCEAGTLSSTTAHRNAMSLAGDAALLVGTVLRHFRLVREMARRELVDMHVNQMAGFVWLVVHPLVLFAVYAVLFTVVFQIRIAGRGPEDYLVYLFSGLGPWLFTQDAIARSTQAIAANVGIVKKVTLPPEILVAKTLLSSITVQTVLMSAVMAFIVLSRWSLPPIFLLLPVLIVVHLALVWGLALLLSALTPYIRDIPEIVRVFLTVNIYLIPIMYLPDMVPGALKYILYVNPFSYLVWCYQDVLYFAAIRHPEAWIVTTIFALALLLVGSRVFARLRNHFADVL